MRQNWRGEEEECGYVWGAWGVAYGPWRVCGWVGRVWGGVGTGRQFLRGMSERGSCSNSYVVDRKVKFARCVVRKASAVPENHVRKYLK